VCVDDIAYKLCSIYRHSKGPPMWGTMSMPTIKSVPFAKLVIIVVSRELKQISNQKVTWRARRKRSPLGFLGPLNKSKADSGKRERSNSNYKTRFDQVSNGIFHSGLRAEEEGDMRKGSDLCEYRFIQANRVV
jgi:hypothetical protein